MVVDPHALDAEARAAGHLRHLLVKAQRVQFNWRDSMGGGGAGGEGVIKMMIVIILKFDLSTCFLHPVLCKALFLFFLLKRKEQMFGFGIIIIIITIKIFLHGAIP